MLAGDHAAPCKDLRKKFIEREADFGVDRFVGVVVRGHDVHVDISVAGVTKTRDRIAIFFAQIRREFSQVHKPAARDDDVFVQLGESGSFRGEFENLSHNAHTHLALNSRRWPGWQMLPRFFA